MLANGTRVKAIHSHHTGTVCGHCDYQGKTGSFPVYLVELDEALIVDGSGNFIRVIVMHEDSFVVFKEQKAQV